MRISSTAFTLVAAISMYAAPASATLIGSAVTGSLVFSDVTTGGFETINYFDPKNLRVPETGYSNSPSESNSTTVTITGKEVEFGFNSNGILIDTANFNGGSLTINSLLKTYDSTLHGFQYVFSDVAFAGLNIFEVSDSFLSGGVTASLVGTTLTITGNRATVSAETFQSATFSFASAAVPEPATVSLFGLGLLGFAASRRKLIVRNAV